MFLKNMIQQEIKTEHFVSNHLISVVLCSSTFSDELYPDLASAFKVHRYSDLEGMKDFLREQSLFSLPDVILLEVDEELACFDFVDKLKHHPLFKGLVVILLGGTKDPKVRSLAMKSKVNDLYIAPFPIRDLQERIEFLVKFKLIKPQLIDLSQVDLKYKTPLPKRVFDVVTSSIAILLISPLLLVVALIIKMDSPGSVIFRSKRVGAGYRIFDFYKFRSMRVGASEELIQLSNLNQYDQSENGASTFLKLKNDPRTTKFGRFIRKFSIDELPQLFNVLKGDMSLVGNRPLPLYEAEMLTSNEWAMRFLGPAGLTGLWQVSRRGKADMSERERKKLDNFYAKNSSFWLDLKILLNTIPAIVQKEKV
ncbi:MAG: glycosyl transferase [Pedobacter sp.]|nr:glycosyl transferase [Pedobacter sp.]